MKIVASVLLIATAWGGGKGGLLDGVNLGELMNMYMEPDEENDLPRLKKQDDKEGEDAAVEMLAKAFGQMEGVNIAKEREEDKKDVAKREYKPGVKVAKRFEGVMHGDDYLKKAHQRGHRAHRLDEVGFFRDYRGGANFLFGKPKATGGDKWKTDDFGFDKLSSECDADELEKLADSLFRIIEAKYLSVSYGEDI